MRVLSLVTALVLSVTALEAQWPRQLPSDVPRTATGELDLDAPTPRTADGKPDLSGLWRAGARAAFSRPGPGVSEISGLWVIPFVGIPRTEYGEAIFKERQGSYSRDNPRGLCLPVGILQLHISMLPARYIQTPRELVILYEGNGERRDIFTDGRTHPENDPQPWWNGYSVGRWEGDTLVVDTSHFRDGGWLDMPGNPLTDAARITERFRRTAFGRMEIDITVMDPKAYLRPFTVRWNQSLMVDQDLIESVCENNRYANKRR